MFPFPPLLFLLLVSLCANCAFGFELALFASSGCYSHDVMMREVGEAFDFMLPTLVEANNSTEIAKFGNLSSPLPVAVSSQQRRSHQIHWVQIFTYDFGFGGQLPRPAHWQSVVMENEGTLSSAGEQKREAEKWQLMGHQLLWQMNIPFDHDRLWDLRGAFFFFNVLRWNHRLCERFVRSQKFQSFRANAKLDLVVVDHFIQECFEMSASLMDAPVTIQFSNWPIADGYISSFNAPSPPSAYPMTGTTYSPKDMPIFWTRLRNCLWHLIVMGAREIQANVVRQFYTSIGHPEIDLYQMEAKHLFYAGRAEFLVEPIRPINNRIRHFGCANCKSPNDYYILDKAGGGIASKYKSIGQGHQSICSIASPTLNWSMNNASIKHCLACNARRTLTRWHKHTNIRMEERYKQAKKEWPKIDWAELEQRPFILISFGSIAKVEFMPSELLAKFLHAFSQSPHLIIWQTNSPEGKMLIAINEIGNGLPGNVRLLRWAPIKTLFAHPNLRYSILHGGVNTLNEALMFGKPILGLPLQGDQPSNLQRLVDLGMAELMDIRAVWADKLPTKMAQMDEKYEKYAERARKVTEMVEFYRHELGGIQQNFWLQWAAKKRHLIHQKGHKFFHFFHRSIVQHFALFEATIGIFLIFTICLIISR